MKWHLPHTVCDYFLGCALGEILHGEVLHGEVVHGEVLYGEVLHGEVLHGEVEDPQGTGSKLKISRVQAVS